jgi:hypothetical protein
MPLMLESAKGASCSRPNSESEPPFRSAIQIAITEWAR